MKIGIDASRAFIKKRTGIEEYSHSIIKNLTLVKDASHHKIFLYVPKSTIIDFDLPKNFIVRKIGIKRLYTQVGLSFEIKRNKIDLLFVPSYAVPIIHPTKTVAVIHGLEYKQCPSCYPFIERKIIEFNTLISIKFSTKIIVPSKSVKNDIIKFYKINPTKINVVNHGVKKPSKIKESFSNDSFEKSKNGKTKYILFIGRLEKRKNIANLIKAFDILCADTKISRYTEKSNLVLILAGAAGYKFEEIKESISKSKFRENIILRGYISEKEKEDLYKKADLFMFPSFCEGFGFPIVEAMSYGIPVVCSNSSSLPDIAGKSALLVDASNAKNIARAAKDILIDDELRKNLVKKGIKNAGRFDWEKCAEETFKLLLSC